MNIFLSILFSVLVLLVPLYFYLSYRYFRLDPRFPGLKPEFFFGSIRQMGLTNGISLGTAQYQWQKRFGDIFQYFICYQAEYAFSLPEHFESVFTNRKIWDQSSLTIERFSYL